MNAVLPDLTPVWHYFENTVRSIFKVYGYEEIRLPIVERTELFKRSIGEVTDIVEKEMYTFDDLSGESLTLRPEGTAGCVRAVIDNGLIHNQQQRLWYMGPMFRYEKPQEGRYRQFTQIGIESFGFSEADIEFEHLLIAQRLWQELGIEDVSLEINSLGAAEERAEYRKTLVSYLQANKDQLDADSLRRLDSNPLRILDSKNPEMQGLLSSAPKLIDSFGEESKARFNVLIGLLEQSSIQFTINPRLVRGLDYYSHTVYEWVTNSLGAQGTLCAGGRFDGLVEQLGGRKNQAVGFAIGIDRVILMLSKLGLTPKIKTPDVYIIAVGTASSAIGFKMAEELRDQSNSISVKLNCGGGSFKSQMKRADKSGAKFAILIGEDEIKMGEVTLKYLREESKQLKIAQADLVEKLVEFLV